MSADNQSDSIDHEQPVVIETFADSVEAILARLWLSQNGVNSTMTGEELSHTLSYVESARRIQLLVARHDADRAATLLDTFHQANARASHGPWRCPNCDELCGGAFDECWQCGMDFQNDFLLKSDP